MAINTLFQYFGNCRTSKIFMHVSSMHTIVIITDCRLFILSEGNDHVYIKMALLIKKILSIFVWMCSQKSTDVYITVVQFPF